MPRLEPESMEGNLIFVPHRPVARRMPLELIAQIQKPVSSFLWIAGVVEIVAI
jgi:hypothetical protein